MAEAPIIPLRAEARGEWVRLRTLINLRWLAIVGQSAAVMLATLELKLALNVGLCLLAIGASVLFNIATSIVFPETKRLSERETAATLMFDLSQLVFLLYLTGGLSNPFALLILAPVTISATALSQVPTIVLGMMSILLITVLVYFNQPLTTESGAVLVMPDLFLTGFWVALSLGVVFLAVYARRVTMENHSMSQALLATQMALSREQKLTDLGGIVAAAAHELGTPLATIKLVSAELADELADELARRPELKDDIDLIRSQADRCRDILRDMGRTGHDDRHLRHAPISALVREAAEPHEHRGKNLFFSSEPRQGASPVEPQIRRHPEIIHGLRNLVQNAVDFAACAVWVDIRWNQSRIFVTIADDGKGYPADMIGRIGDPFVRRRPPHSGEQRPGYEGMGLGLFIAKTLLERTGAELTFANGTDPFLNREEIPLKSGAIVEVAWPRNLIEQSREEARAPLGRNTALTD
ncbi:MAG: ActS/PrrB/RegB family redox-sensitive histidine kinase [Rhodobacteraceae bacterium]|nr:ActS/PrrB/RegB family redox-sensitive histidine kinase [Paracoccaceae bacterium]